MLFTEAVEKFKDYLTKKDYAEKTIYNYSKILEVFNQHLEKKYNGQGYLSDVVTEDIEDYIYQRKLEGDSSSTRTLNAYTIRSFYKFVARKDHGENITLDYEPPKAKIKEREYLTAEEMDRVLAEIEKPLIRIVALFIFNTAARISEALDLKMDEIDFENDLIKIIDGKNSKDRTIPLNSTLKKELEYYFANVRPKNIDSDFVFATAKSGSLSAAYFNRRLKKAVAKAGIPKAISAHNLRHSCAVFLTTQQDVALPTIQRILGHENLQTTSVYLHADPSQMRDALEAM